MQFTFIVGPRLQRLLQNAATDCSFAFQFKPFPKSFLVEKNKAVNLGSKRPEHIKRLTDDDVEAVCDAVSLR